MEKGRINVLKPEKKFGKILPDGGGALVFFHFSKLGDPSAARNLRLNAEVEFERGTPTDRGECANSVRVTKLGDGAASSEPTGTRREAPLEVKISFGSLTRQDDGNDDLPVIVTLTRSGKPASDIAVSAKIHGETLDYPSAALKTNQKGEATFIARLVPGETTFPVTAEVGGASYSEVWKREAAPKAPLTVQRLGITKSIYTFLVTASPNTKVRVESGEKVTIISPKGKPAKDWKGTTDAKGKLQVQLKMTKPDTRGDVYFVTDERSTPQYVVNKEKSPAPATPAGGAPPAPTGGGGTA